MKHLLCCCFLAAAGWLGAAPFVPAEWSMCPESTISGEVMEMRLNERRSSMNRRVLSPDAFAGRLVRVSGEFCGKNILKGGKYDGGKIIFSWKMNGRTQYMGVSVPPGSFDWKPFSRDFLIPAGASDISLGIGFQNSSGVFKVRNLELTAPGTPLDFSSKANMGLIDEAEGDGRGGWSDQGPRNDGRTFARYFRRTEVAGIPFRLIPEGNSVLTMKSKHFPQGPESVRFDLPGKTAAKSLYLLHTLCWGVEPEARVGTIEVQYADGGIQKTNLICGQDVADWWNPGRLKNAYPAFYGSTGSGGSVAVYLSRFPLERNNPVSVTFRSLNGAAVWIIAGATLTGDDLPLPVFEPYVAAPGREWVVVKRFPKNRRVDGSALDVSAYLPKEKAGAFGRVIAEDGHFAFEKAPDRKIRFFTCSVETLFDSKADIDIFVKELRKNGYNMVRTHFYDYKLTGAGKKELEFDPAGLDLFDYMVHAMKENGIYLNFDCMTSWNGYAPGNIWGMKDRSRKKNSIYFDPAVRENWRKGVETLLCRKNPYTGMRLVDDPVLALTVGYNEQEFAFIRDFDEKLVTPPWRQFLKERYQTIEALKKAWGRKASAYRSFDDVPCFQPQNSLKNGDTELFVRKIETEQYNWYRDQLRKMGYKGLVTNYNMSKNLHYSVVHAPMDFVAMNSYHAHPSSDRNAMRQTSSIASAAGVFRDTIATRLTGKPFLVTEHGHVFWNRYRYEQGFVIGAYAAFQDIDGLTVHAAPYSVAEAGTIRAFKLWNDPVNIASEFLTFFAFGRGDVAPARSRVRIAIDAEDAWRSGRMNDGLSFDQTSLALMTGFSTECYAGGAFPMERFGMQEFVLKQSGGARVVNNTAGFSATSDRSGTHGADSVRLLKQRKLLPAGNRSNGETLFVSSTDELTMDIDRRYMAVNAPRLQGICADPGTGAKLADFQIRAMTAPGCLAAVAVDGLKPLREAERIVIVYSTNALNSGSGFTSPDLTRQVKPGGKDVVLKTGRFTVALRNRNAAKLRLYPLDLAGNRLKTIAPDKVESGMVQFTVDTAKDGASLFFEVAPSR